MPMQKTVTPDQPWIFLEDGPLMVMRGYVAYHKKRKCFDFVGAHDGPYVRISGPNDAKEIAPVEFVPKIIEALKAAIVEPVATPGAHDVEIMEMGFDRPQEPAGRRRVAPAEPGAGRVQNTAPADSEEQNIRDA